MHWITFGEVIINVCDISGGSSSRGGGGGGGRIALHYSGDNHYTGSFLVQGGSSASQAGGSGTVYTAHLTGDLITHQVLHLDNAHLTKSERIQEIEKLELSGSGEGSTSQTVTTPGNIVFSIDQPIYEFCTPYYSCTYRSLVHVMSGSASDNWLEVSSSTALLTVTLPSVLYIRYLKLYPQCSR